MVFSIIKHWLLSQGWHWRRKSMTYLASRLGLNGHSNRLQGPNTDGDLLCIQLLQNAFIWALMYIQLLTIMLQSCSLAKNLWETLLTKKSTNVDFYHFQPFYPLFIVFYVKKRDFKNSSSILHRYHYCHTDVTPNSNVLNHVLWLTCK